MIYPSIPSEAPIWTVLGNVHLLQPDSGFGERWKVHSRDPCLLRDPLWPKSSSVNLNHFLDSSNGYSHQSGWTHLQSSRLLKATSEAHWTRWTETCECRVQIWNWTHGYQACCQEWICPAALFETFGGEASSGGTPPLSHQPTSWRCLAW